MQINNKNYLHLLIIVFIQYFFCTNSIFAQNKNPDFKINDIKLDNSAINYLQTLNWKENQNKSSMLKTVLFNIISENNDKLNRKASKKDISYALFTLIQIQRTYSKFPISINKKIYDTFPEAQLINDFDKNFKNKPAGIIFNKDKKSFFKNKTCITDAEQSNILSNKFSKTSLLDTPIGIVLDNIETMKAVNMFGETIATFHKITTDNSNINFAKYRVQINSKFVKETDNTPFFVSFNLKNCNPNDFADTIEQLSKCNTCKFFLQINKIFFNVADTIYLFFSKYLLAIIAIVMALRFLYSFGKEHYNNMGNIDYKSMFFSFTKIKIFKVILFVSLLWVHPAFIVKWTIEPITLMAITLSKEILNAGGSIKNKKTCKESELIKSISEDIENKKVNFIQNNNILFMDTEKLIDGNLLYDNTYTLKNNKKEQDIILSGYSASILCNVYEVRDFLVKHQIVGSILTKFAITEFWIPSTKTTGGVIQSIIKSPIFYIIIGIISSPLTAGYGVLTSVFTPLLIDYNRTTVLINLLFFGLFLYISMILFNFILFLYFIDLCANLAVLIMKIPLYLILWIFNDQEIIDLSFSDFFGNIKGNVISIASISFIVTLMMTFMEYIYYNFLEIPVGAIDKAFEYGRSDIITNPIAEAMASGKSNLNFAFLDIMLMILTFWYISRNMDKLLGILGGNLPGSAISKDTINKIKSLYTKVININKEIKKI